VEEVVGVPVAGKAEAVDLNDPSILRPPNLKIVFVGPGVVVVGVGKGVVEAGFTTSGAVVVAIFGGITGVGVEAVGFATETGGLEEELGVVETREG
jgi:hypothetical protein